MTAEQQKYKEQIEKEAKEYADSFYPNQEYNNYMGCLKSGFISGVNSEIAERIKIEFAISVLEDILKLEESDNLYSEILNKITKLKNEIK